MHPNRQTEISESLGERLSVELKYWAIVIGGIFFMLIWPEDTAWRNELSVAQNADRAALSVIGWVYAWIGVRWFEFFFPITFLMMMLGGLYLGACGTRCW